MLPPGGGATEFRAAALVAGFPENTAVKSLNRQCSSGLQACIDIANAIRSGMIEIGVGSGVESMSSQYGPGAVTEFSELLESHPEAKNCKVPMGVLSEKMAKDRSISRKDQDVFAASSYQKALKAQQAGKFDEEIEPLTNVKFVDPKTDEEKIITVAKDDGIRDGITAESLGKIKPAFAKDGSIHAGNASQISDGAAAVLLMKRSTAERLGQKIVGKFVSSSVVGVKPLLMGIGPWKAIPVALQKAGISKGMWMFTKLMRHSRASVCGAYESWVSTRIRHVSGDLHVRQLLTVAIGQSKRRRYCFWTSIGVYRSKTGVHIIQ